MGGVGVEKDGAASIPDRFGSSVVNISGRMQPDAGMTVIVVIPTEESTTVATGVFEAAEPIGELRSIRGHRGPRRAHRHQAAGQRRPTAAARRQRHPPRPRRTTPQRVGPCRPPQLRRAVGLLHHLPLPRAATRPLRAGRRGGQGAGQRTDVAGHRLRPRHRVGRPALHRTRHPRHIDARPGNHRLAADRAARTGSGPTTNALPRTTPHSPALTPARAARPNREQIAARPSSRRRRHPDPPASTG